MPHAVAVEMIEVKERPDGMIYASAVIYGERDSQKGILIGKNGAMLKKIGRAARIEMERKCFCRHCLGRLRRGRIIA